MEVYGYDPYLSVDAAWGLSRSTKHAQTLDEIYANCDYITVHVPLTPDTKEMINAESIAKMQDHVRILNFARGDLVNSADLLKALADGKVASYVTDFPTDEMLGVEGVVAVPHLAHPPRRARTIVRVWQPTSSRIISKTATSCTL